MLELRGVRKSFGDRDVLRDVSLPIDARQRVALVGPNGAGKSTLLKIILGDLDADAGEVRVPPWATVAYLPQEARCTTDLTLDDELLTVFASVQDLERQQRALEAKMLCLNSGDPRLMPLVAEHSRLHDEFERLEGYTLEAEVGKVLAGLGFSPADRQKRAADFSGGWQMRIALAKLLLQRPSLLLLDEPTNHLDLAATVWLEEYLREYRGAVIIVSHDRYFLDRVAQRTAELADGVIRVWAGNYSQYVAEKARSLAAQEAAYGRQQTYLAAQQTFIERFRASARRSAQAKSRERALEKIDLVAPPPKAGRSRFCFAPHRPSGREVLILKDVAKAYGGRTVFANCELVLERGDKVALVGENGAGKTTLLRLMAGLERPDQGHVRLGIKVERSYYAQHQADSLDEGKTVFDELYTAAPAHWTTEDVRSLLGRFHVGEDVVFKAIKVLSGGERSRVALAKMLLRPANVLLLDEPTNHLDIPAREMLEDALRSYEGTIVLVSHDRYFLDKVATKVVELAGATVRVYGGNYSYYLMRKVKEAEESKEALRGTDVIRPSSPRRGVAGARTASPAKQLADLEREIGELERKLREVTDELAGPECQGDTEHTTTLLDRYHSAAARLADLNGQWEALARAVEEAAPAGG